MASTLLSNRKISPFRIARAIIFCNQNEGKTMRWITTLMSRCRSVRRPPQRAYPLRLECLEARELLDATNVAFVTKAYQDLLRRPADPAGLANFTSALDNRLANRVQVALGMQASAEFQSNEVQAAYRVFLRRDADPSGFSTYTAF